MIRLPKIFPLPSAFYVLAGICLGLGLFTFIYAGGHAYLSSDPRACMQCHVMREPFDSWQKSPHHAVAKCVDCHLSHNPVKKWIDKGENGTVHSALFTLNAAPDPIKLRPWHRSTVLGNCRRCHAGLVDDVSNIAHQGEGLDCMRCHAGVAHGAAR